MICLTECEVSAVRWLLSANSVDTWSQMGRLELEGIARQHKVEDVSDFPDICFRLGIGDIEQA